MIAHLKDIDIFYEARGSGRPVYLLHGLALDHSIWMEMAETFADQAQFIIPDLRGHGQTPLGDADGSIEQFADDVLRLADHLGHQQFCVAGHSMGGYIALALAEAHPERLTGLALVTSNTRSDSPEKREDRLAEAKRALTEGMQTIGETLIQRLMPKGEPGQPDEHMVEIILNTKAEGFANVQTAIAGRPNRLNVVQTLDCPVLAIAGGQDQITPVEVALEPAEHAPNGRSVCLPGVGHMPMLEVPYTLGALLVGLKGGKTDFDFIFGRRSIREFTADKVPSAWVKLLLEAAMAAPNAMNLKPWQFVVVDDPEKIAELRKMMPFGKYNAPLAFCVCGNLKALRKPLVERFWVQDCSAATENLLLTAHALGLGSVWCGVHPVKTMEASVRRALKLPEGIIPLNIIYVGYPAEKKPARTQYDPAKVWHNLYDTRWEKE